MRYALLADFILLLHGLFILFVVLGALLALRWRKWVFLHLPACAWGIYAVYTGTICPLTPLENHFRIRAGQQGYRGSFIEHYLLPLIYPANLTESLQITLSGIALLVNLGLYGALIWRWFYRPPD